MSLNLEKPVKMHTIDNLNQQFGIARQLEFVEDESGFVMVDINNNYAKARISSYAGQVISYQPHTETEDLVFLSDQANYQTGKAIRGGVPICWPWFGDDTSGFGRPSHGFMRNQQWNIIATHAEKEGATTVILGFDATDTSKAIWPYDFQLRLEITVGKELTLKLTTKNTGQNEFTITQALHTYFNISDIEQVTITGLDNKKYLDKLEGFAESTQAGDVQVSQEIDRVFQAVSNDVQLTDKGFDRQITVSASGSETTVIWNPWTTAIGNIADLDAEHYRRFLCVETVNAVTDSVAIPAGEKHSLSVTYLIN